MKNVLFLAQKGGTGKSTLAIELLASLQRTGVPCVLYDLDQQGLPIDAHEDANPKVAVVDTPGALLGDTDAWIREANVIVVPTKASRLDITPLLRMLDIVAENKKKKAKVFVVVNMLTRFTSGRDFMEWLPKQVSDDVQILTLPMSEIVIQATANGESIVDFAPRNSSVRKSALRIVNEIRKAVKLPKEDI